jgi:hypothetical protein
MAAGCSDIEGVHLSDESMLIGPSLDQEIRDLFMRFQYTNQRPNSLSVLAPLVYIRLLADQIRNHINVIVEGGDVKASLTFCITGVDLHIKREQGPGYISATLGRGNEHRCANSISR